MGLKFGVTLPTFTWPDLDYKKTATIVREFSRRAEELGFASLTVWDHLTDAPGLYGGLLAGSVTVPFPGGGLYPEHQAGYPYFGCST